jgi:dienelactone hydrolase/predicted N-acetyltransferase YhbS
MPITFRTAEEDDWVSICHVDGRNFGFGYKPEQIEKARAIHDPSRFELAFDGKELVAIVGAFTLQVTVPGSRRVPMGGITWVSTTATHRRQGLLTQLMARTLADIDRRGESVAMLGASEGGIYERYGFGVATVLRATSIDRRMAQVRPELRPKVTRGRDSDDQAKDLLVRGRTLMGAIVQEIRQSVTYLQSRPDVDRNKIGMTGMSFGGITTFYTWLVDDRIAAAAPICGGVGSVDVFLKTGRRGYHGFYWWVPDMLTVGDQGDFAAALAPRPLMLWAPTEDIGMPKEGVPRFLETARPAYEKSSAQSALVVHRPAGEHSFTLEAFAAMEQFFRERLKP